MVTSEESTRLLEVCRPKDIPHVSEVNRAVLRKHLRRAPTTTRFRTHH
jgi:hypothetical protein